MSLKNYQINVNNDNLNDNDNINNDKLNDKSTISTQIINKSHES